MHCACSPSCFLRNVSVLHRTDSTQTMVSRRHGVSYPSPHPPPNPASNPPNLIIKSCDNPDGTCRLSCSLCCASALRRNASCRASAASRSLLAATPWACSCSDLSWFDTRSTSAANTLAASAAASFNLSSVSRDALCEGSVVGGCIGLGRDYKLLNYIEFK